MEKAMQRYFFHLNYPRDYIIDPDGGELPDLQAAKSEARQIAVNWPLKLSRRNDYFCCTASGSVVRMEVCWRMFCLRKR
jgi:hypothetical protein